MLKQLIGSSQEARQAKATNRHGQRNLLPFFWLLLGLYTAFGISQIYSSSSIIAEDIFGASAISLAAIIPVYLWCSGRVFGIPIFPLFSLTYLWTCALPLLTENPAVFVYSVSERLFASTTVTGFLALSGFIWYQFVNKFPEPEDQYRVLPIKQGDSIFLWILLIGNLYIVTSMAGWLLLDAGTFALLRGAVLGLTAIATFAMSYRYGSNKLSTNKANIYIILIVTSIIVNGIGLLLINSLTVFLITIVGYSLGRGKFPWISACIVLSIYALLHAGKSDIRQLYWQKPVEPSQYISRYVEWIEFGIKETLIPKDQTEETEQSIIDRASVLQQLLLTQSLTEKGKPLLEGYTYSIIPQLLVPRFLNSEKITSHEGTSILNIYYGRQTRRDTQNTTIGWGLLSESYANFGLWGCGLLALIIGAFYGYISLLSINAPVFSDRYLFAILVLSYAFQTEFTAGVYVAALFQSSVTLLVFVFFLMKVQKREAIES